MVTSLSKRISLFLYKNQIIKKDTQEIYTYGIEIIISTTIGFLITLSLGIIFNMLLLSFLYYFVFVTIRQFTGGYHAKTHLRCKLIFIFTTFLIFSMTKLTVINKMYSIILHIILLISSIITIGILAPVENFNKPLTEKQKKRNRNIGLAITILFSIVSCLLFKIKIIISALLAFTLFTIAFMIVIAMPEEKKGGS